MVPGIGVMRRCAARVELTTKETGLHLPVGINLDVDGNGSPHERGLIQPSWIGSHCTWQCLDTSAVSERSVRFDLLFLIGTRAWSACLPAVRV